MPLNIPTRQNVVRALQAYVATDVPELDTTINRRRSGFMGFVVSFGSAVHDFYVKLKKYADSEPFPQTASKDFFEIGWWLAITGLGRNPATAAQGSIVITGENAAQVPAGAELTLNGQTYTVDNTATVLSQTLIGELSAPEPAVGRFVTAEAHQLATGVEGTFSGGPYAALNITAPIRVIDPYTIEYDLDDEAVGPELEPNPVISATWGNARVTCTAQGAAGNIDPGTVLTFASPLDGIDSTALLTFDGVADGAELETLEHWRARVLEALATDFGMFTAAEIRIVAKTIPGVTRVFIREPKRFVEDAEGNQITDGVGADGYPTEGRVRIAFLRENDADPIPSALEVEQVRQKIHGELLPAHTLAEDVEVLAPERYNLEIRFRSISPDTPGMRRSIREHILQFLKEEAGWGGVFEVEGLRCAIRHAYDGETKQALKSYDLDSPSMNIALPVDAYPVLSGINWRVTT